MILTSNTLSKSIKGKKSLILVAQLLIKKHPDLAEQLLIEHNRAYIKPLETDESKISLFFAAFCNELAIDPKDYSGPLFKSNLVDKRNLFVSIMLDIYNPQCYSQPLDNIQLTPRFPTAIGQVLKFTASTSSRAIRNSILMKKLDEGFEKEAARVKKAILKKVNHGKAQNKEHHRSKI